MRLVSLVVSAIKYFNHINNHSYLKNLKTLAIIDADPVNTVSVEFR